MKIRPAAVAGGFYPSDPKRLAHEVDEHLAAPAPYEPAPAKGLRALVVPHAGYIYSGPTAGIGYRLLPPLRDALQRVVMVGPAHYVPVPGVAVSSVDAWETPLGDVPVDAVARKALMAHAEELRSTLTGEAPFSVPVELDDLPHGPEHCLEVQLPFLQRVLPGVPILPMLVGTGDSRGVARLLQPWWDDPMTLILVSSDLSHYERSQVARKHDAHTAEAILAADADAIEDMDACGCRPLRGVLRLAHKAHARVRVLDMRNSSDTAGEESRVVGYGAFAMEV